MQVCTILLTRNKGGRHFRLPWVMKESNFYVEIYVCFITKDFDSLFFFQMFGKIALGKVNVDEIHEYNNFRGLIQALQVLFR